MNARETRRWFEAVASLEFCVLCRKFGVQVSHCNVERGMGQKSAPYMTAALCPECHHWIDNGKELTQQERRFWWYLASSRTMAQLIARGLVELAR